MALGGLSGIGGGRRTVRSFCPEQRPTKCGGGEGGEEGLIEGEWGGAISLGPVVLFSGWGGQGQG